MVVKDEVILKSIRDCTIRDMEQKKKFMKIIRVLRKDGTISADVYADIADRILGR